MKVNFKNQYELFLGLITGDVAFESEDDSRWLVNSICNTCVSQSDNNEVDVFNFFGGSGAWDIDEWCQEVLQFNGWDIDWYDVITMNIYVDGLQESLQASHDFSYSNDEMRSFIEEFLSDWKHKALSYFKSQLTKASAY